MLLALGLGTNHNLQQTKSIGIEYKRGISARVIVGGLVLELDWARVIVGGFVLELDWVSVCRGIDLWQL